ncbi:hypothetical protein ACN47A_13650 [Myxococcus fulvus]|uniref:hypothetical protein n=1 Tax=Myxococcus fulvus TaxID=33 RepID=UPI003B99E04B
MHPPCAPQLPKSVLLAGVALLLGLITWSPPAQAQDQRTGFLGYATYSHHGTEPRFESICQYTHPRECYCKWGSEAPWFDTVIGCSMTSQADAEWASEQACWDLCSQVGRTPAETGGVVIARFPSSEGLGVTLDGAGTIFQVQPGRYLGVPVSGDESVGPFHELEYVGELLATSTGAAWNWLVPGDEPIQWEDPYDSAAIVQSFSSEEGEPPQPIGQCVHAVVTSCAFDDPRWGDSLLICSNESEDDAWRVAETSCMPMRHEALVQSLQPWATYHVFPEVGVSRPPSAIITTTPHGFFLGYLPNTSGPARLGWEWTSLAEVLSSETQGAPVWLAGELELYESQP